MLFTILSLSLSLFILSGHVLLTCAACGPPFLFAPILIISEIAFAVVLSFPFWDVLAGCSFIVVHMPAVVHSLIGRWLLITVISPLSFFHLSRWFYGHLID